MSEYIERDADLEEWIDEQDGGLPLEELMGDMVAIRLHLETERAMVAADLLSEPGSELSWCRLRKLSTELEAVEQLLAAG